MVVTLFMLVIFMLTSLFALWYYISVKNKILIPQDKTIETLDQKDSKTLAIVFSSQGESSNNIYQIAETFFLALHGLYKEGSFVPIFSFELVATKFSVNFYLTVPTSLIEHFKSQVYAQYPNVEIHEVEDPVFSFVNTDGQVIDGYELKLKQKYMFPIATFKGTEVDPLNAIVTSMRNVEPGEQTLVQYVFRPIPNKWQKEGRAYINALKQPGSDGTRPQIELYQQDEITQIERKSEKQAFQVAIRIAVKANDSMRALRVADGIFAGFRQFAVPHLNSFIAEKVLDLKQRILFRFLSYKSTQIFNVEEIAGLFHLPEVTSAMTNLYSISSRKLPPPEDLPYEQGSIFAMTDYRGISKRFGITDRSKLRHVYIIGKSGSGKSTLMKNMIVSDIYNGNGVAVMDPHGELVEDILNLIPEDRIDDVVYFNPADTEYPVGFNPINIKVDIEKDVLADAILAIFKKYFESWGPRLEYILYNAILTVIYSQGTTLLSIQRMLIDKNYRKRVLSHVKNPVIHKYWDEEFASMEKNTRLITESLSAIQNKIGRFLSPKIIRNILGQVRSTIDIADIMNNRKIFIINLSKGKIGEENASLLGGLLITSMYFIALDRAKLPEAERPSFSLYIDEVQNFSTDTFINILSEARKYHLGIIMAHQFTTQLPKEMLDAIFGNVGTTITFSLSQQDAYIMSKEFAPYVQVEDFLNLNRYQMYLRMVINDRISRPFSAVSLPLQYDYKGLADVIREKSRRKYGVNITIIEEKLRKWYGIKDKSNNRQTQNIRKVKIKPAKSKPKYNRAINLGRQTGEVRAGGNKVLLKKDVGAGVASGSKNTLQKSSTSNVKRYSDSNNIDNKTDKSRQDIDSNSQNSVEDKINFRAARARLIKTPQE